MNTTNKPFLVLFLMVLVFFASPDTLYAQEPWSEKQLLAPSDLAELITNENKTSPLIISVSPEGMHGLEPGKGIKGSVEYGAAEDPEKLSTLKAALQDLPKDAEIVLYCGCCPFNVCPNVRPAFTLLNELNFTNHKLLNLEKNIRVDWMNKGYPMN